MKFQVAGLESLPWKSHNENWKGSNKSVKDTLWVLNLSNENRNLGRYIIQNNIIAIVWNLFVGKHLNLEHEIMLHDESHKHITYSQTGVVYRWNKLPETVC